MSTLLLRVEVRLPLRPRHSSGSCGAAAYWPHHATFRAIGGVLSRRPLGVELLADRPHRLLALILGKAIDVQHAVEVVDLVLQGPSHESLALDGHGLAVEVDALDPGIPSPLGGEPQARHREAPLIAVLVFLLRRLHEPRVEHVADVVIDVPRECAQADADLVGGQPRAPLVVDRLEQVLHERLDPIVDVPNLLARRPKHRVANNSDLTHSHGGSFPRVRALPDNRASPWEWLDRVDDGWCDQLTGLRRSGPLTANACARSCPRFHLTQRRTLRLSAAMIERGNATCWAARSRSAERIPSPVTTGPAVASPAPVSSAATASASSSPRSSSSTKSNWATTSPAHYPSFSFRDCPPACGGVCWRRGGCSRITPSEPLLWFLRQPMSARWRSSAAMCWRPTPSTSPDRKSTRLNSSHVAIAYAVFGYK